MVQLKSLYLSQLNTIANQALRICTGASRTSPISSLQAVSSEPPLHLRREEQAMKYFIKLQANPSNTYWGVVCFYGVSYAPSWGGGAQPLPKFFGTPYTKMVWPGVTKFEVGCSMFLGVSHAPYPEGAGLQCPDNYWDVSPLRAPGL